MEIITLTQILKVTDNIYSSYFQEQKSNWKNVIKEFQNFEKEKIENK